MSQEVIERVSQIVEETLRTMRGIDMKVSEDMSLIDSGIVDSLSVVSIVQGLQDAFKVEIMASDITLDNFGSVAAIAKYVRDRMP